MRDVVTWCLVVILCAAAAATASLDVLNEHQADGIDNNKKGPLQEEGQRRILQSIEVPITIQESVGASSSSSSNIVSVVVPFAESTLFSNDALAMQEEGYPIQVQVLERWVSDDSIRHALIHIQLTNSSPLQPNERRLLHLVVAGGSPPTNPVSVSDNGSHIQVDNGKIRFRIQKNSFNIIDELWFDQNANGIYEAQEIQISNNAGGARLTSRDGTVHEDSSRSDITVKVEENGPLRAIIRVSAPTLFVSNEPLHGFAVRLYVYADSPHVKIDYQLQNSASSTVRSWPLYFEQQSLEFDFVQPVSSVDYGGADGTTHSTTSIPSSLRQTRHDAYSINEAGVGTTVVKENMQYSEIRHGTGFMHAQHATGGGVTTVLRNMWQTWPNGLSVSGNNKISVELFPEWSAQWMENTISPTGLYWLDDMQHVYKEMLLVFHSVRPSNAALVDLTSTFQLPPVVTVSPDWHRTALATLDLGGFIPTNVNVEPNEDTISPDMYWLIYGTPEFAFDDVSNTYAANWANFGDPEPGYRNKPCTTGGFPYVAEQLVTSQYSSHYFLYETWGIGELNVRPQWLSDYTWETDQGRLQLTENPYCGGEWRLFENQDPVWNAPLLAGTSDDNNHGARDDQHGWFYHAAQSYFYNGNYWMRDWFEFVAQFRRIRLSGGDPFPDMSSRAVGHSFAHALAAARITGDEELLDLMGSFFRNVLRPRQDIFYGSEFNADNDTGPGGGGFQTGYLMRAVINYMDYIENRDLQLYSELFQYVSGVMEWNRLHCHFSYYYNQYLDGDGQGISGGTGQTLVNPQAWYFLHTGKTEYWDHIDLYMQVGINGGTPPYGAPWLIYSADSWSDRIYHFVRQNMRSDLTPPPVVNDLRASSTNSGLQLTWTTPADAVRYHVVWSDKPIVEEQSLSRDVTNWWAANPVAFFTSSSAGALEAFQLNVPSSQAVFIAVFSFDESRNMSPMSNVAQVDQGPPLSPTPPPTSIPAPPPLQPTPSPTPIPAPPPPITAPNGPTATHIFPGDSFESAVESLQPGDTLIVHEGDYVDSGRISIRVFANQNNPVVVQGAAGEGRPRILRPSSSSAQNTINVEGSSYLTIRGLEIMSNGGDGVKFVGDGNTDILLEDLVIHEIGVGVNVQSDIDRLTVRRCHIYDTSGTGEGMYLGCHDGSCIVTNSLFEGNLVHDTTGSSQGDGIELKKNSYNNIIRDNVIYNTNYPCILLYGSGVGAQNIVEGNAMWNCALGGIQVAADAVVRNNLVFDSGYGLLSQTHNGVSPKNLRIVHNTFVNHNICLNIRAWNGRSDIVFANNAVYCSSDTMDLRGGSDNVQFGGNVFYPAAAAFPSGSYGIGRGMDADFVDFASLNAYPMAASALRGFAESSYLVEEDFDGVTRSAPSDVGAYEWGSDGQLWDVIPEFKSSNPTSSAPPLCPEGTFLLPGIGCLCFPGSSKVQVRNVGTVLLRDLKIGDHVLVAAPAMYEPVMSFGHYLPHQMGTFVEITTSTGTILISALHMIELNKGTFVPAGSVQVGDSLVYNGGIARVRSRRTDVSLKGLYAPFTPSGTIVVDGFSTSCYVAFDASSSTLETIVGVRVSFHWLAHSFEVFHRIACHYTGPCNTEKYTQQGMSTWVAFPLEISTRVLMMKNELLKDMLFGIAVVLLGMLRVAEYCFLQNAAVVVIPLLLLCTCISYCQRRKHRNM